MEISRFPCKRLLRMPGSTTTRGRHVSCDIDTSRVAFCGTENIGTPNLSYAAQYLACALPCERFASALASIRASLGAGVARYAFTVTDFHRLPSAGLPAHPSTSSKAVLLIQLLPPQIRVPCSPDSMHDSDGPEQLRFVPRADKPAT